MKVVKTKHITSAKPVSVIDCFVDSGFLQGAGGSLPDVDVDYQSDRRQEVSEVSLGIDEQAAVGKIDKCLVNRGITMRMILHAVSDYIRDLDESSVICLEKRMHDSALDRLETIYQIRYGPVSDDI